MVLPNHKQSYNTVMTGLCVLSSNVVNMINVVRVSMHIIDTGICMHTVLHDCACALHVTEYEVIHS